ncbi:MAG: TRAP transporter small permease [Hyphomicrobiales bacterium]|nr:TRAP transporter small permease [Hyphomicrobiales bacterium]MBV9518018.1 TRAP transporter small permease [Hyphomicrobiales bacterium]
MRAEAGPPRPLSRIFTAWDLVEETLVGLLGLLALLIGVWGVLSRYFVPARSISYGEEVTVYLIVWAIMIVSSQLVRRDGHVRPDLVLRLIPPRAQRFVEAGNCILALGFSLGLAYYGWQIVETALLIDEHSSTDLQFPMWVYYLSLPTGAGLMAVRYLVRFLRFTIFYDTSMSVAGVAAHETMMEGSATGDIQTPDAF